MSALSYCHANIGHIYVYWYSTVLAAWNSTGAAPLLPAAHGDFCWVQNNDRNGGAINVYGTATLSNCIFSGNTAVGVACVRVRGVQQTSGYHRAQYTLSEC
jgi:hypothetical protein